MRLLAGRQFHQVVDRAAGQILGAGPANGIKTFHRQTDRIEPLMAPRTFEVVGVRGQQLADRLAVRVGLFRGERDDIGWRGGDVLAQQMMNDPEPALHGAGPLGLRVLRQEDRHSQQAAASLLMQARDFAPLVTGCGEGDAVVLCQALVHQSRVAIQQLCHRAVLADQMRGESTRFFEHRLLECVIERGEDFATDRFLLGEVTVAQPLAEELEREAADLGILQHAAGLGAQDRFVVQPACFRHGQQFLIRLRGPQEITQPGRERQIRQWLDRLARRRWIDPVTEVG